MEGARPSPRAPTTSKASERAMLRLIFLPHFEGRGWGLASPTARPDPVASMSRAVLNGVLVTRCVLMYQPAKWEDVCGVPPPLPVAAFRKTLHPQSLVTLSGVSVLPRFLSRGQVPSIPPPHFRQARACVWHGAVYCSAASHARGGGGVWGRRRERSPCSSRPPPPSHLRTLLPGVPHRPPPRKKSLCCVGGGGWGCELVFGGAFEPLNLWACGCCCHSLLAAFVGTLCRLLAGCGSS